MSRKHSLYLFADDIGIGPGFEPYPHTGGRICVALQIRGRNAGYGEQLITQRSCGHEPELLGLEHVGPEPPGHVSRCIVMCDVPSMTGDSAGVSAGISAGISVGICSPLHLLPALRCERRQRRYAVMSSTVTEPLTDPVAVATRHAR